MAARVLATAALVVLAAAQPDPHNCTKQPAGAFVGHTLTNANGLALTLIPYGATAQSFLVPDRGGVVRDILLGFDDATQYCANAQHPYFGATIGRVANRIAKGTFVLDGVTYHTPINEQSAEGGDTLHGGDVGFDRRTWAVAAANSSAITFTLAVADGEQGFPGAMLVSVTHSIGADNVWRIAYSATTSAPATVISMTNHACALASSARGGVGGRAAAARDCGGAGEATRPAMPILDLPPPITPPLQTSTSAITPALARRCSTTS